MQIKNFTGNPISLGEFPYSVTIQNIPASHSNDGIMCDFFTCRYPFGDGRPRIVIVKNPGDRITVMSMRYGRQSEFIPEGDVLYDSEGILK
jgi:hypothetical protein